MVWDSNNSRSYAKDLELLGQFSPQVGLDKWGIRGDSMKVKGRDRAGNVEIKVVRNNGDWYIMEFYDIEDISYMSYQIEDFMLINRKVSK